MKFSQYLRCFLKFSCFLMIFTALTVSVLSVTYGEVSSELETAEGKLEDMEDNEIPTSEAEKIFEDARDSLESQRYLETMGEEPDYEGVQELVDRLFEKTDNSLRARDELDVLEERLEELKDDETLEISEAEQSYERAVEEFEDQNFESALESVDETYERISEARSAQARVQAYAESRGQNLLEFAASAREDFFENPVRYSVTGLLILSVFFVLSKIFIRFRNKRELKKERNKVEALNSLIEDLQTSYYENDDISTMEYKVKFEKFEEMEREAKKKIRSIEKKLENDSISSFIPKTGPELKSGGSNEKW